MMASQLQRYEGAAATPPPGPDTIGLRIFSEVPPYGHDVVQLLGMVAVYTTDWREVREGAFYVVESQRPVAGMSWETHDRLNRESGEGCRSRLATSRQPVLVERDTAGRWWHRLPNGTRDGPIHDWAVGHNFVGEIVGIYQPTKGRS